VTVFEWAVLYKVWRAAKEGETKASIYTGSKVICQLTVFVLYKFYNFC
jgi:hypothetical protein